MRSVARCSAQAAPAFLPIERRSARSTLTRNAPSLAKTISCKIQPRSRVGDSRNFWEQALPTRRCGRRSDFRNPLQDQQKPKPSDVVRLSSNENPYGPSPAALKAMTAAFALAWKYPDDSPRGTRRGAGEIESGFQGANPARRRLRRDSESFGGCVHGTRQEARRGRSDV